MASPPHAPGPRAVDASQVDHLHDVVLPEIGLLRLMLASATVSRDDVAREIDRIEHDLRLRQLDLEIACGVATIGSTIQPFVRYAQRARVAIAEIPTRERADRRLATAEAYRLRRFLGVAVPNAVLAGARRIGISIDDDADGTWLSVVDDAGGFDPADAGHCGRGRDRLAAEIGAAHLRTVVGDTTTYAVRI